MKKTKTIGLTALLALTLTASVPAAIAYFTTYASASGTVEITLQAETEIVEELPDSRSKRVQVQLSMDSQLVYVRVRVFSGSQYAIDARPGSNHWNRVGEYWEYAIPLYPKEGQNVTDPIVFGIEDAPADVVQDFNVIVVSESVPVEFDEEGQPLPADWNKTIEIERGEGR
ncbi:hypothetical protein [uncultured Dubosiella sp.]|uniref:hypothetical protein n=1 Tax=uncultured Dubosiella sp. TaxID=1937011 RepID=UPI00266F99F7|nr:hypothetical protein [uncultured Dubosiella sp.]